MKHYKGDIKNSAIKICSKCIYDERVNGISFDSAGICNYCNQIDELKEEYGTENSKGENILKTIVEEIKKDGKGKKI